MAEHRTSMKHEKERETKRLQVENQYLKLILDKLYKSIMVGESTPQMEAKLPEDLRTDQALIELTTNIEKVHQKFHELETEMCDIHRQISQFSFMILGDDRSEERTPAKINKFTATGRQPRSNPVQRTGEAEQSLKLDKYLELVASAWIDMKEKEKKLQDDLNKKEKIIVKVQAKTERDEVQNKTTAEGNNGKQQNYSEPALPQEQDSSDKIPVMTSEEENNLRYLEERETLRRQMKTLEEENKKLQDELTLKEIKIVKLEEGTYRRPERPRSAQPPGQRHVGVPPADLQNKIDEQRARIEGLMVQAATKKEEVKTLEEENKKLQDELTLKEIKILKLEEATYRRPERPRSAQPPGQRHVGIPPADLQNKIDEQQARIEGLMVQAATKKEECDRYCNERDALNGNLKHCEKLLSSLKEEKLDAEKKILELRKEKDELLNRLSKIASDRLTHDNTDITDLSDEFRPTKLAEKMSELYDNQWTRAFDELKANTFVDEEAIGILLKILMFLNITGNTPSVQGDDLSRYKKLKETCSCFEFSALADGDHKPKIFQDQTPKKNKLSIELQHDIKWIWRESSKNILNEASPVIRNRVADKFHFPLFEMSQTPAYLKECVELCWMMNLQEKPMHLDISVHEKDGHKLFDSERFRSYTKSGQYLAFVVWPALYLFEDGPVLKKGVAQGSRVA